MLQEMAALVPALKKQSQASIVLSLLPQIIHATSAKHALIAQLIVLNVMELQLLNALSAKLTTNFWLI